MIKSIWVEQFFPGDYVYSFVKFYYSENKCLCCGKVCNSYLYLTDKKTEIVDMTFNTCLYCCDIAVLLILLGFQHSLSEG